MSYKNQKSLVVVAGVIAALFAGTVLLGGYAKFAPAKSETDSQSQVKGCCPMMGTQAAFNVEACPAGRTEACCAEEGKENCCGKPCPPDCPKPCCAKETATSGCGVSVDAAGCCPATTEAATK